MTTRRNQYTREFKLEAISLAVGHKRKVVKVTELLEIGVFTLDKWLPKYKKEK